MREVFQQDRLNAHQRAEIRGAKEGQPKRTDDNMLDLGDAFRRFNLSIARPILGTDRSDIPNPDFIPVRKDTGRTSISSFDQIVSERLLEELEDQQKGSDEQLNRVFLNRDARTTHPDNAVSIYHGLYMNVIGEEDESGLRILELVRQMPTRALMSFDFPGMGHSDPLTKEQKTRYGPANFFGVPEAELRVLQRQGVKKINLFGISMGGLLSLATASRAAEFGIEVENVIAVGTPGIEHVPLLQMGRRSAGEMNPDILNLHHSSPADPRMWQVSNLNRPEDMQLPEPPSATWNSDPFLRYARMMAKDLVGRHAHAILETQPHSTILFVNGSEDRISRPSETAALIQSLRTDLEGDDKKRVQQVIMPGDGHLALIHPKLLAPLIKSQLDGSFM